MPTSPTFLRQDFDDFILLKDADVDEVAEKDALQGPCRVDHIEVLGPTSGGAYLKLYDDANPTVGTSVPDFVLPVTVASPAVKTTFHFPETPLEFRVGLSWALVQGAGTAGTTAPASTCAFEAQVREGVA